MSCWFRAQGLLPITSHTFISLNNMANIAQHLLGKTQLGTDTTPIKQ